MAASKPDVIIATQNTDKEQCDRLTAIAPVVSVGGADGKEDPNETWKDRMTRVGEALDLKSAAEAKIKDHDDQMAALREEHPEFKEKRLTDLELFKNVPVVKDGRTVFLTNNAVSYTIDGKTHDGNLAWALAVAGPLAQVWAAKELSPYLSQAIQK